MSTFTLSVEPVDGPTFLHGYHLGTIESVARDCAEDLYGHFNSGYSMRCPHGVNTVALMRDGKLFDCYDGLLWSSKYEPENECDDPFLAWI